MYHKVESRAESRGPEQRHHRLDRERTKDRKAVRLQLESWPQLFEARHHKAGSRRVRLVRPQVGEGAGGSRCVVCRDQAIDFLACFGAIHRFEIAGESF
jgi:hypothetical protein